MSEMNKNPDQSNSLHLGKFAPGAGETTTQFGAEPSPTIAIKRAAAEIAKADTPILPKDGGDLSPTVMLGAVSYCYAKGVYVSEEIEDKMRDDPKLREAGHGEMPDADAIRRFRRLNRGAIQRTLEKAFSLLKRRPQKPASESTPKPPAPSPTEITRSEESTMSFARHEAAQKVNEAAFIDNMSKDRGESTQRGPSNNYLVRDSTDGVAMMRWAGAVICIPFLPTHHLQFRRASGY